MATLSTNSSHRVVPYTQLGDPTMVWALRVGQLFASALPVLVAINLAILVYARTMTRLGGSSDATAIWRIISALSDTI